MTSTTSSAYSPAYVADAAAKRSPLERLRPRHAALAGVLALSAVLNTHRLAQNGYANTFYSAGVRSMLDSWHNFWFVSFDPGGLVTIDKPPLGVWAQVASAKLFGFSPLSLLLPEAIFSTIAVAVLYRTLARRLGAGAGLAGALALAVFPSFVAVSRDNGVDPLLILLMVLACASALNAIEDGRLRWLLSSAVLVALAFNTKTLAAYLIVPGIALAYLLCAPGSWRRRGAMLLAAAAVMAIGSFAWIATVELTPASQRPFVGSSTDNTELGLTFGYNGFGRVEGEAGGPDQVQVREGARLPRHAHRHTRASAHGRSAAGAGAHKLRPARPKPPVVLANGRLRDPISFGGATGPMRLFESRLADQGSWLLPFALVGMVAFAVSLLGREMSRRDPRLALLLVLGGWLLCEALILSFSRGIVHPYYISALAPGVAAMVGAGTHAFARAGHRRKGSAAQLVALASLLALALVATVVAQVAVLEDERYMRWLVPVLIAGTLVAAAAMAVPRLAAPAMAALVLVLLLAPTAYDRTTWLAPVQGTFPAAGPHQAAGDGGVGISAKAEQIDRNLIAYVSSHRPGTRWAVLTDAAPTAAPLMLLGLHAGAIAGYSGTDPALNGPQLARLIARGLARYVVLGGAYASRGGNLATAAVLRACPQVPHQSWHGAIPSPYELVLFDCAGRERELARLRRLARSAR